MGIRRMPGVRASDKISLIVEKWKRDPVFFAETALGINPSTKRGLSLTLQQREGLNKLRDIVFSKINRSMGREIGEEEKKLAGKLGISIMSGQGCGKDTMAAISILWFLACFPNPKIICTAPTSDQLRNILWSEVSKWLNHKNDQGEYACALRDQFVVHNDKIFLKEHEGKRWFATARTSNPNQSEEEQSETLAGFHEDCMLIIADEASGIPDAVFRPLEGSLTGRCNLILLIFNPTRNNGYAIDSHFGKGRDQWVQLHWNGEESELVSKDHIKAVEEKYGKDSNFYRIRIKGVPPRTEEGTLIPYDWISDSVEKELEVLESDPVVMGVDCAGEGADKSIILVRQGPKVIGIHAFSKLSTIDLAGWVLEKIGQYEPDCVCVDPIGLGAGVYDQIRLYTTKAKAVNVSREAKDSEKFTRLRDELWWKAREHFENGTISIPNDPDLVEDLSSPKFEPDIRGRIKVESKRQMRLRGIRRSPDKADALCLSLAFNDAFHKDALREERSDVGKYKSKSAREEKMSWMVA